MATSEVLPPKAAVAALADGRSAGATMLAFDGRLTVRLPAADALACKESEPMLTGTSPAVPLETMLAFPPTVS